MARRLKACPKTKPLRLNMCWAPSGLPGAVMRARLRSDNFAALVNDWQNRLSGLNDDYAEAPPNLLPQIEARLFPQAPKAKAWRLWLGGALAATAIAAAALFMPPPRRPWWPRCRPKPRLHYVAAIAGDQLTLTRTAGRAASAGKDYELWIIDGDKPPVSLGVLTAASVTIPAPKAAVGFLLAITLEPKGGAPEGKPTGPILAAGPLKAVAEKI